MEKCDGCETKVKLLKGDRGPKGEKGDRGERGPVGAVGPLGATGGQGNRGDAGNQGIQGEPGTNGTNGAQGIQGVPGAQGDPGVDAVQPVVEFEDTCTVAFEQITGFPTYKFKAEIVETAWLDLVGFAHQQGSVPKPKVKRIGNQLHFKGNAFVPLAATAGGTVINMGTNTTYNDDPYNYTFRGVGGCKINTLGSIGFNYDGSGSNPTDDLNGCLSVLPEGLLCSNTIDDSYQKQYVAARQINTSIAENGTSLSAVFQIIITSAGQLFVQTLRDIENNSIAGGSNAGGSALRYITSNVRAGEFVPNFSAIATKLHSFDGASPDNIETGLRAATTYLFDCDAAQPEQIGGFQFSLDGLIAYLT